MKNWRKTWVSDGKWSKQEWERAFDRRNVTYTQPAVNLSGALVYLAGISKYIGMVHEIKFKFNKFICIEKGDPTGIAVSQSQVFRYDSTWKTYFNLVLIYILSGNVVGSI